jgi:hypothetical protein
MYLDQITNDELADVGRLTEMAIRAGMTVMKTVSQYRERQILQLTSELKDYRLANPLLPKGDISDLSYFWASDSLSRQVVQEMPEQAREKMKAMLTQLERQGIVLAGPDGWTLTEPGRKMVYDKYFVQDALKADIEYANQVQQTVQKVTGPATKETAIWRNVGEELRQIGKDAANSPKDAIQRLQNINRALKHDSKLNGSSLQKAITHAMREIVVEGKPVTGTIDTLAETTGHLADELLINFNDLTLRTENEIRRESTKSAAVNAGSPAIAAAPVIAAAMALANGTRKASRQITR